MSTETQTLTDLKDLRAATTAATAEASAEAREPQIDAQGRYLNDKEREVMHALRELVERKDDLDFQVALQTTLKYWLFLHIPLTYSLLIFSAFQPTRPMRSAPVAGSFT